MLKYIAKIFIPSFLVMAVVFSYILYMEIKTGEILIEATEEVGHVRLQIKTIGEIFEDLVADLNYLSVHHSLQKLISKKPGNSKKNLAMDFLSFSKNKKIYDQIRFIDVRGNELIRINYNNGTPTIVPKKSLRNKGDRYYFKETISLKNKEIYISPFDLNMENGQVEKPYKPMIRFATPIYDVDGKKQGIIILNYLGATMLDKIRSIAATAVGEMSLLNYLGYWFVSHSPDNEWGFMFEDRKDNIYKSSFPEAWSNIIAGESGQFYTSKGLFTFATVYPTQEIEEILSRSIKAEFNKDTLPKNEQYTWKTVSHISPDILNKKSMDLLITYSLFFLFLCILLFIISLYFANIIFRTKQMHSEVLKSKVKAEQAQKLLLKSEEKLKYAQHMAQIGSWELNINKNQMTWSDEIFRIFNIDKTKSESSYGTFLSAIHPDDREQVNVAYNNSLKNKEPYDIIHRLLMKDGEIKYVREKCRTQFDDNGLPVNSFGTVQDITKLKKAENKIIYMAQHDVLTDLPNKRLFEELSNLELVNAKRNKEEFALLFIDIDGFKLVNDTLGHTIGDLVLQIIANLLKELVRESDIVSRFGGDEFVILLPNQCDSKGAIKISKAIIEGISQPIEIKNKIVMVGASIGITLYPADADCIENLLSLADKAMYHAKKSGKNTWKMANIK